MFHPLLTQSFWHVLDNICQDGNTILVMGQRSPQPIPMEVPRWLGNFYPTQSMGLVYLPTSLWFPDFNPIENYARQNGNLP